MDIRVTVTEADGSLVATMSFNEATLIAFAGRGLGFLLTPGRTIKLERI